jgi:signal transduction histidine kinase
VHDLPDPTERPPMAAGVPDATLLEVNRLWTIVRAFSNTAHDVNNALQVIAGSAELLEARDLEPAVRRRVETIREEASRAATTINRLLTYTRAEPGAAQAIDLWPVVEDAVAMRVASAGRHRIVMRIEGREASGSGPCWARVNAARTTQALLALLLAAEGVIAQKRGARIAVGLATDADRVRLQIAASCDEDVSDGERVDDERMALTGDAELWAAASLMAAEEGSLQIEPSGQGRTLTLTLPGAPGPFGTRP